MWTTVWGRRSRELLGCPSPGLPYLSDQPLPLSFRLLWAWFGTGPIPLPLVSGKRSLSALLGVGVCWRGGACIQITPWKTKHCLKGLREGLVQTGTAWFCVAGGQAWGGWEEKRGEGRKGCGHCVPSESLWVCLSGRDFKVRSFVRMCAWSGMCDLRGAYLQVCLLGFVRLPGRGFLGLTL